MATQKLQTRKKKRSPEYEGDAMVLKGRYRDFLTDGRGKIVWKSEWSSNLVVESCNALLAALLKRETDISGILYWAMGSGAPEWDRLMPRPKSSDTRLQREIARKGLNTDQIIYLDETGAPSETPRPRLQITVTFRHEELDSEDAVIFREFGLFGGDATAEADSGMMVDYVIHPQITLSPGMALTRNLHLTFGGGTQAGDGIGGFGASLPVISIDGVGRRFSNVLNAAGVNTLNDLLARDPLSPIRRIPGVKLREFRAKARLVLGFRADLVPFMSLTQTSLSDLLKTDPAALAAEIDSADVTGESISRIQEDLALLQVALDDSVLQEITLAALSNT